MNYRIKIKMVDGKVYESDLYESDIKDLENIRHIIFDENVGVDTKYFNIRMPNGNKRHFFFTAIVWAEVIAA